MCTPQVLREDRGAEAVRRAVRSSHGLLFVLEGRDDDERAEDLLLEDAHRVRHVREDGGLDKEALARRAGVGRAAVRQSRAIGLSYTKLSARPCDGEKSHKPMST